MNGSSVYVHCVFMRLQFFLRKLSSAASLPKRWAELTAKLIHLAAVSVEDSKDPFHRPWTETSKNFYHCNDIVFPDFMQAFSFAV